MAFAMAAAALLVFAVGCDDKKETEPAIGIKMSVIPGELEFNDRCESGDIAVSVEEAAEWSYSVAEGAEWIGVEAIEGGLRITVEPIKPDKENNVKSRSGRVDIKAVRGIYNRVLSVAVKQYADNEIPADGPIHFYDAVFERMMVDLCDADENGKVSPTEAKTLKELVCSGCGIESLNGIEYFRNLTSADFRDNALTLLDFSKNTKLAKLDVRNNPLVEVVLGRDQNIADLQIDDESVIVRR